MYDTDIKKDGDCALYVPCSQVQLARVGVRVIVLVDVVLCHACCPHRSCCISCL